MHRRVNLDTLTAVSQKFTVQLTDPFRREKRHDARSLGLAKQLSRGVFDRCSRVALKPDQLGCPVFASLTLSRNAAAPWQLLYLRRSPKPQTGTAAVLM